jgi:hypothetical protein
MDSVGGVWGMNIDVSVCQPIPATWSWHSVGNAAVLRKQKYLPTVFIVDPVVHPSSMRIERCL